MAENDNRFTLKVITPDRVFYEEEVSMVEFNTVEGEVGIYKQHIPMTMIISQLTNNNAIDRTGRKPVLFE